MKKLICAFLLCAASVSYAGFDEGVAAYQKGNYAIALKEFKKAAEKGDATAQYNLGLMYAKGKGVPQDDAQAVGLWQKAAEQGHVSSQFSLGLAYDNGEGVPQNYKQAVEWYTKAAKQGYAMAQFNLGSLWYCADSRVVSAFQARTS